MSQDGAQPFAAGGSASGGTTNITGNPGNPAGAGGDSPNGGKGGARVNCYYPAGWGAIKCDKYMGNPAGGGGGGYDTGGGGGGYSKRVYSASDFAVGSSITVVVGAGGAGGYINSRDFSRDAVAYTDSAAGAVGAVSIVWTTK